MKPRILVLSAVALALVMVGWPTVALAQRTSGGAPTTGTAVSRGGDSGGGAVSRGDSGSGSPSGSSSASGGSVGMGSMGSSSGPSGPMHFPGEIGVRRAPGSALGNAMPVGVPEQSRPRGGRPSQGEAVQRGTVPGTNVIPNSSGTYYDPYSAGYGYWYNNLFYSPYGYSPYSYAPYGGYSSWGYWPYGFGMYGLGLGYFYYDPFYSSFWGYGGGYGDAGAAKTQGSIKLKVKPADAQVFVDGAYVGRVDDFNGVFQHLDLDPGPHRIEVKADGYQPLTFEVRSLPGRTITYEGELKK